MSRRVWIAMALSFLLGAFTAGMAFAISPSALVVTGPALCASGTRFSTREGATVALPDNQRGAPVSMDCIASDGARSTAHVGRALGVLVLLCAIGWFLAIWSFVRRIPLSTVRSQSR